MTVTVNDRRDITLDNFRRVSEEGEGVVIGERARSVMDAARHSCGELARSMTREGRAYDRAAGEGPGPLVSLGDSFGPPELGERVVRGILFARLADLVEGHAACRPEVAELLAAALDGPMPRVPLGGSVSAGEVVVLSHAMSVLPREMLEDGEQAALIDGAPCAAALAADSALQARQRIELAEAVFSLSVEAMNAPLDAYHPALGAMWGDQFVTEEVDALNRWLEEAASPRRPFQAPVSYRILPGVLGQVRRAAAQMEEVAEIALGSVSLARLYVPPSPERPGGLLIECGGSYQPVYPAMSTLAAAWADLCTLADRHATKLHRASVSLLPELLAPQGSEGWASTSLLGFVQIGFGERARHAATRTFLPSSEGGAYAGQEDVALPNAIAYERETVAASELVAALAVLAVVASQALDLAGRESAPSLRPLLDLVRLHVPVTRPGSRARPRGQEIGSLAASLASMIAAGDFPSSLRGRARALGGDGATR